MDRYFTQNIAEAISVAALVLLVNGLALNCILVAIRNSHDEVSAQIRVLAAVVSAGTVVDQPEGEREPESESEQ